ncbi:MAG: chorismate mutase [Actinomycetes bacterium]|jgi:chorismate mutase
MSIKAIRGAVCLTADDATEMADAVTELLTAMLDRNGITASDLVSVLFTATPDIHSGFPAAAARSVGLADVPLICAQELDVTGAMPMVIRTMMHAEMNVARADVKHVYLRGAEVLRQDIAQ